LREFETQIPDPAFGLLNFTDPDLIGTDGLEGEPWEFLNGDSSAC
jgi:hypothetical protein